MLGFFKTPQNALAVWTLLLICSFFGCRGLTANPPPPQDFSISLSPATLAVGANTSDSTFTVSIAGQNRFANPVSVTISALPAGPTRSPSAPFSVAVGSSQTVTLSIPATVQAGSYTLTVGGASGA